MKKMITTFERMSERQCVVLERILVKTRNKNEQDRDLLNRLSNYINISSFDRRLAVQHA